MEVVREAQKVAKLKSDLTSQGLETRQLAPITEAEVEFPTTFDGREENSITMGSTKATTAFTAPDGVKTHFASNVEWMTVDSEREKDSSMLESMAGMARPVHSTTVR